MSRHGRAPVGTLVLPYGVSGALSNGGAAVRAKIALEVTQLDHAAAAEPPAGALARKLNTASTAWVATSLLAIFRLPRPYSAHQAPEALANDLWIESAHVDFRLIGPHGQYTHDMTTQLSFTAIYEVVEEGWTQARIEELPAVITAAPTLEQAKEQLLDALREYLLSLGDQAGPPAAGDARRLPVDIVIGAA